MCWSVLQDHYIILQEGQYQCGFEKTTSAEKTHCEHANIYLGKCAKLNIIKLLPDFSAPLYQQK